MGTGRSSAAGWLLAQERHCVAAWAGLLSDHLAAAGSGGGNSLACGMNVGVAIAASDGFTPLSHRDGFKAEGEWLQLDNAKLHILFAESLRLWHGKRLQGRAARWFAGLLIS